MNTENNRKGNRGTVSGRSLRFWGENWLETMGISLGAALVLMLFWGFGKSYENMQEMAAMYGYYLIAAGGFIVFLVGVTYYQTYFSLLVSMNATRKQVARDILINVAAMILGVTVLAALVWTVVPGELSEKGLELLPLLGGVLFIAAAFCVALGTIIAKWGKVGMIIFAVVCVLIGGCAGSSVAFLGGEILETLEKIKISESIFRIVAAAGVLLYAAAGIFSVTATRKTEVR